MCRHWNLPAGCSKKDCSKKLVLEKREDGDTAQRILALYQEDLGRQKSDLTRLEGQLKASEEAQMKARDNCMVI